MGMIDLKLPLLLSASFIFYNVSAQDSQSVGPSADRGKMVYEQSCLACHQADGSGVPFLAPPLIEGIFVEGEKKKLIEIVLKGLEGVEIKREHYANPMPAFDYLTDAEIAEVLTYVRSNFKNDADAVTEEEVRSARQKK